MHAADAWQQPRPGAGNVAGDDSWRTLYDEPDTEDYLSLTEDEVGGHTAVSNKSASLQGSPPK